MGMVQIFHAPGGATAGHGQNMYIGIYYQGQQTLNFQCSQSVCTMRCYYVSFTMSCDMVYLR